MIRIAVIGDRQARFAAQDTIEPALQHSASALGTGVAVQWISTPALVDVAAAVLADADAIWCAPGSPYLSLDGALAGIRFARERRRPFLGTCAGFQHAVIEFARNVAGIDGAHHAEYGPSPAAPLIVDELICSLVGETMKVRIVVDELRAIYGGPAAVEQYYCRFGLNESYTPQLAAAGLVVAAVDDADGSTRIVRLTTHPFFYATLFVPQVASTPEQPHPIVTAFLAAARRGD